MKSTLLMRIQGMEQEVCQLFFATLCRKIDSKWQEVAGNGDKAAKLGGFSFPFLKMLGRTHDEIKLRISTYLH